MPLLLVAAVSDARAASLADYRARVHESLIALDTLAASGVEEDVTEREARVLEEVRRNIRPLERVEWAGGSLEADNAWLHNALTDYERMNSDDTDARSLALRHISERLAALEQRLAQADAESASATERDKEAEKGRLGAILRRPEYNQSQTKNESALKRLFEQLKKWLNELIPQGGPMRPGASPGLSRAAQLFIYGLCLTVLALLIWKFGGRLFRRADAKRTRPRREARIVLGEELSPEQSPADLLSEAERLARAGDVRGAIRKGYIALLCELGDRRLLRLAQHKTNRDYLNTLRRERAALYREMQPLTLNFERHWYGHEAATVEDWTDFRTRCRQALKTA